MRSHRAMRQLATLLAKKGFHVLRFDYRGTGDSFGDLENTSVEHWIADISTTANELLHTANVRTLNAVGLRLGALLAYTANRNGLKINKLTLWDPVISGSVYDQELISEMENESASRCNQVLENGTLHYNGFSLQKHHREALSQMDMTNHPPQANKVLHIVSHETEHSNRLKDTWSVSPNYSYAHTPAPGDWNYVDEFGGILLPQPVIQAIVGWMDSEASS